MQRDSQVLAGLDIGGTKIGICLGDSSGALSWKGRFDSDPRASPDAILEDAIARLEAKSAFDALGVSCPGPFLAPSSRFIDPPNMPRWHGFDLGAFLRRRLDVPFSAKNDANALALAEHRWGAGRDYSSLVFLTMSTGMGAGLILDGRLYEGPRGFAGEVGHLRLADEGPVGFGKRGSVEGFLSGPGLAQQAEAEVRIARQRGESTLLGDHEALDARVLCEAASRGDAVALRVTRRAGRRLGQLMAILVDVLEPEIFVLGTIGRAWPALFIEPAREILEQEALTLSLEGLRVAPSELADHGAQSALALAAFAVARPTA